MTTMTVSSLDKIETFDSWASDYYEPAAIRHYDQAIARMLAELRPPAGGRVFDAGCGTGVHSIRVAAAGFDVRAVDISAVVLETAKKNADRAGVGQKIAFEQADLTNLRFADASFDAVFSWGVVIHIPEMEKALAELVRVLKPGGRIALQVTNGRSLDCKLLGVAHKVLGKSDGMTLGRFGRGGWCDMHGGKLYNWMTDLRELTRTMEQDLGCRKVARISSEFTEIQRRVRNPLRWVLRQANNAWFAMRLPAGPAITNIMVFEKGK